MEHDTLRHAESPVTPLGRERDVELPRQDVGEAMESQRGLVRENAGTV
jgi:hypothetical protein